MMAMTQTTTATMVVVVAAVVLADDYFLDPMPLKCYYYWIKGLYNETIWLAHHQHHCSMVTYNQHDHCHYSLGSIAVYHTFDSLQIVIDMALVRWAWPSIRMAIQNYPYMWIDSNFAPYSLYTNHNAYHSLVHFDCHTVRPDDCDDCETTTTTTTDDVVAFHSN